MAHGALTPIIGRRLLALAAGLRHNAEIGQPGLCFSAYGHKFGINHLALAATRLRAATTGATGESPLTRPTCPRSRPRDLTFRYRLRPKCIAADRLRPKCISR